MYTTHIVLADYCRLSAAEYAEEMKCNYERYRNLVINLFQEGSYIYYISIFSAGVLQANHADKVISITCKKRPQKLNAIYVCHWIIVF